LIFVLSWSTKISSTRLATLLTIKGCTGYHIRRRIARYHIRYPGGCIKYCCRFRPSFQVRNDAILFKKYKYLSNIYLKWSWRSWQYFTWNDRGEAGNIFQDFSCSLANAKKCEIGTFWARLFQPCMFVDVGLWSSFLSFQINIL
jgi:hypothetical protein